MWECPQCGRGFKRRDQNHTCTLITKESLFAKRSPGLKTLFDKIEKIVSGFGDSRQEAVKPDVIFFKTKSTFLGIKIKKDHLVIEYFLDHLENVPPVFKYLQTSKHRVVHLIEIDSFEDITPQLIKWMKMSYALISKA